MNEGVAALIALGAIAFIILVVRTLSSGRRGQDHQPSSFVNYPPPSVFIRSDAVGENNERMGKLSLEGQPGNGSPADIDEGFSELILFVKEQGDESAVDVLRDLQISGCNSLGKLIDKATEGRLKRPLPKSVVSFLLKKLEVWGFHNTARHLQIVATADDAAKLVQPPLPRSAISPSVSIQTLGRLGCGNTSSCSNYQKPICPLAGGATHHVGFCPSFLDKSINYGYGGAVAGHWRRSRSGKMTWIKPHSRRR